MRWMKCASGAAFDLIDARQFSMSPLYAKVTVPCSLQTETDPSDGDEPTRSSATLTPVARATRPIKNRAKVVRKRFTFITWV